MEYTFSWGAFFIGIMILLAGAGLTVWYRPIADNFGGGIASYDRYRMWGLITCGIGLLVMFNIHTLLLTALIGVFFHR